MSDTNQATPLLAKYTAEIIGGVIVILLGFYARLQGKRKAPIYLDQTEIELRITNSELRSQTKFTEQLQVHEDRIVERLMHHWPVKNS